MENQMEILNKIAENQASLEKALETKNSAGVEALQKEFSALNTKVEESNAEIKAQKDAKEAVEKKLAELEADMKRSSGHELAEKKEACKKTNESFRKYLEKGINYLNEADKKYLRTDVNIDGGFLVPDELSNDIIKVLAEVSPLRRYARNVTISQAAAYVQRKRLTRPAATWVGEGQDGSNSSNSTFGQTVITPGKLRAHVEYTNEMIQDTGFNILSEIRSDASEQFALTEGEAFCNGDGINKPKGFTTDTAITSVNSAVAGNIGFEDIINLQTELNTQYQPNAKLFMNKRVFGELRQKKDAQGAPIFSAIANNEGISYSLLGSEVVILDAMDSDFTSAGKNPIFYGDMASAYVVATKGGVYTLDDVSGHSSDMRGQFLFNRVGGGVVQSAALKKLAIRP